MDLELKRKKPCLKKEIEALHALLAKLAEMEKVLHYRNQMIKGLSEEAADPEKPAWHIDAITLYRDGRKIIQVAYGIRRMAAALRETVETQHIYSGSGNHLKLWFSYDDILFIEEL
ncbi:MAG: hypothetical protein IZT75_06875 [Pseudoramibacter alactolyticus]|nr:hypothetical protein [Pseudoramibacter alactolyticus]